jgi:hypothetical protein
MSRIIEILLYQLTPNSAQDFYTIMEEVSLPLHQANDIDVVWHGQSLHSPEGYGLIRAFANFARMQASLEAFYAGEGWVTGPRAAIISRIATATRLVIPLQEDAIMALRKQGHFYNPAWQIHPPTLHA